MTRSAQVDAYIRKAPPFAKPILERIRNAFHSAEPGITETIKWGHPHFEYNGILAGMAAFRNHVGWGFWKTTLMTDPEGKLTGTTSFGKKVTDISELPPVETIEAFVREAVMLNKEGRRLPRPLRKKARPVEPPAELLIALRKNRVAKTEFAKLSPSQQREYIEWIAEAKGEATRARRIATAIEWLSDGKPRNWKYMSATKLKDGTAAGRK